MSVPETQCAQAVLMVRPAGFAFNPQTAPSNAFQHLPEAPRPALQAALAEFEAAALLIAQAGVRVIVADDTPDPPKPDAIFPNNWVSFHADGTVVLYPMLAVNRRWERRDEVLATVARAGAFRVTRTVDLTGHEASGQFLEGTGSLVLDRRARIAYACLSPRTHLDALGDFAQQLGYDVVTFDATDAAGQPIYHTNVMMAVGSGFAVICSAAIASPAQRAAVIARLTGSGHEVFEISLAQMQAFAGNILELAGAGGPVLAVSTTAWRALDTTQRGGLARHARVVCVDIPSIEEAGGGGIRCMLAEVHLPGRT
jgi:hypothetical protein